MKLNKRETLILIITLGLIAFFMAYQWVIKPMHEGAADINDQLRAAKKQLARSRQMIAQRSLIEERYQKLTAMIGGAGSEDAQVPVIIAKIEAAARESNIHIANIQPQKSVTKKDTMFLAVELEIDGQWLDIVQFLYLLQQQPNLYFINELNLEKYSDTTDSLRGRIVVSRMCLVGH
jgi:Tfp pilus assembly protein PilO